MPGTRGPLAAWRASPTIPHDAASTGSEKTTENVGRNPATAEFCGGVTEVICGGTVSLPCPSAGGEEVVERLDPVVRHDHLVEALVLAQRAHGERFVVGSVLDQQDYLAFISHLP